MDPVISIIVPVHNQERFIGKCLDSILSQSFTHFEVIVINDGSTDRSGIICDAYAKQDQRVTVLHTTYSGVSSSRNKGVQAARGAYIGFVDGDDYVEGRMYEWLYRTCQETNSDIGICKLGREIDGRLVNHSSPEELYIQELGHQEALRHLFKGYLYRFSLCNKLFKRSCFAGVMFPEGRIHEDLAITYHLFANANQAVYVHYTGYVYVKQDNSILTAHYYEKRLDAFTAWNEIIPFMHTHYPQLAVEVNTCFAYQCVDHAYYIVNQVQVKKRQKQYLAVIQTCIRQHDHLIRKKAAYHLPIDPS
ncbi:putative glycosyltransferase EpsJ [Lentibacillus sp. JNUCC-1]|uniref:glycosyltransferase family 2 protein n=1 Tax=Lentibacillus sp. JNUCC-1 TaxID=2654513 RepID=UPI0012E74DC6|nr:glycosyltransferase [Lentibacillus sp. JNUCC-1]MUV36906.1 putative glycosyltransferase EpsJ [Lentibacillus sp. JNUCC-1]